MIELNRLVQAASFSESNLKGEEYMAFLGKNVSGTKGGAELVSRNDALCMLPAGAGS